MANEDTANTVAPGGADISVATTACGADQYRIVARATLACAPSEVWALLVDYFAR